MGVRGVGGVDRLALPDTKTYDKVFSLKNWDRNRWNKTESPEANITYMAI